MKSKSSENGSSFRRYPGLYVNIKPELHSILKSLSSELVIPMGTLVCSYLEESRMFFLKMEKAAKKSKEVCRNNFWKKMELAKGIEPPTCGLQNRCSAD